MKISSELQNSLRAKFNPDGSPLREYQKYLLELLCDFDELCKKMGIRYWLSQGTVLGAVRHGGFIPWDDDIDVEMLHSDYLKLIANFRENERYALQIIKTDPFYPLPFAKFRDKHSVLWDKDDKVSSLYKYKGAFIDIFYTEYRNETVSKYLNYFFVAAAKSEIIIRNKVVIKLLVWIFTRLGFYGAQIIRRISKIFINQKMGLGYGSHFYNVRCEKSNIFPLQTIDFEGRSFPAPHNCDQYLKMIYGDYMVLPDINEIKTHITKWGRIDKSDYGQKA